MRRLPTLSKLFLCDNNVNCTAADDIADVLFQNTQLQVLDLSKNNFQAESIVSVLSQSISIKELDLGGYNFQKVGSVKIFQAMKRIYTLTKLHLSKIHITFNLAIDIAGILV